MTYSENYDFSLPAEEDVYDIQPISENFNAIDSLLAEQEQGIDQMNTKMGEVSDSGDTTLFGKLNQIVTNTSGSGGEGLTAIKSIQRVVCELKKVSDATFEIQTVDPSKCIVLYERLYDGNDTIAKATYTLNADNVYFVSNLYSGTIIIGLWIIEFC